MLDLRIDRLQLNIADAAGQEHRIGPIVERAAALVAGRLDARPAAGNAPGARTVAELSAPSVHLDLRNTSDEAAAREIADAVFAALAVQLGV